MEAQLSAFDPWMLYNPVAILSTAHTVVNRSSIDFPHLPKCSFLYESRHLPVTAFV